MLTKSLGFSPWGGGFLCESDETPELSPDKCICPMSGTQVKASGTLRSSSMSHRDPRI